VKTHDVLQLLLYFAVLLLLSRPLGAFMADVYEGKAGWMQRVLGPVERLIYRVAGVRADDEMPWKTYALAMLAFNIAGLIVVYALQRLQGVLPLNPQGLAGPSADLSWNTAVSFTTNTNWQSYGGESTLSYFTQMLALAVQNFVSAASGMAVLVALIRGLTRRTTSTIGSYWVDLVRSTLYILVPMSLVLAVFLVSQGVVQTFAASHTVPLLQASKDAAGQPVVDQIIALGPAASQIAIKDLGTNGGGFFNANSAHPFENPTPLSNFVIMISLLLIPAALCHTFGRMVKDARQGWALLGAMLVIFVPLVVLCVGSEHAGNPAFRALGLDSLASMEGKEVRFGITNSALYAAATTAVSNGSVNAAA
jgi:K+-transporting ATPase ATPase A chain